SRRSATARRRPSSRARAVPVRRGRLGAGARARPGPPPRLELDDLVLWIRDTLVVHAKELPDEGLPDPLDVAKREVALVELAVGEPLLDDPGDHRPDCPLVPRRERPHGGLDAVREHDPRRLPRLRLRAGVPGPAV